MLIDESHPSLPVMLLAAGLGTRLLPLTKSIPKCLVPIHDKPLLGYWLDMFGSAGMDPMIVNTHHHETAVQEFIASTIWKDRIILSPEQSLLGTGGTLIANRQYLEKGTFVAVHADNLSRFSLTAFLNAHFSRPPQCIITMMLFRTPTPQSCGIVELDGDGVVTAFYEKIANPPGDLANGAVFVMEPEALDILERCGKSEPEISLDLIPHCLGRIFSWLNDDYHRDIGTMDSYDAALHEF